MEQQGASPSASAEEVGGLPHRIQVQLALGRQRRELDARVQALELLQKLLQQRLLIGQREDGWVEGEP